MLTLAVDTTAEFGSIAILDEGRVAEEVPLHAPGGFSGILFEQIGLLLARHGLAIREIDLFAGASGPGSFTGVRVGLAAIKGLGEVLGKPVVGVSNLAALATFGVSELRATVIDARRGEVFAALFEAGGNALIPESVMAFSRFADEAGRIAGSREFEWITCDFDLFRTALEGTRLESYPVVRAPRSMASAIGRIAAARLRQGETLETAAIEANYVRRSDAELFFRKL